MIWVFMEKFKESARRGAQDGFGAVVPDSGGALYDAVLGESAVFGVGAALSDFFVFLSADMGLAERNRCGARSGDSGAWDHGTEPHLYADDPG